MENMQTFTLLGHEVSVTPSIEKLSGAKYDDVIEHINQAILDGDDAGSFKSFDMQYDWEIYHYEPSMLYTIVVYAVFGGIDSLESFTSEKNAYKYFFDWANENNTENLVFDDVSKALEWFRSNEEELDYTIDFFEHSINNENKTRAKQKRQRRNKMIRGKDIIMFKVDGKDLYLKKEDLMEFKDEINEDSDVLVHIVFDDGGILIVDITLFDPTIEPAISIDIEDESIQAINGKKYLESIDDKNTTAYLFDLFKNKH